MSANRRSRNSYLKTASERFGGIDGRKATGCPDVHREHVSSRLFSFIILFVVPLLWDEGMLQGATTTLFSSKWIIALCSRVKE